MRVCLDACVLYPTVMREILLGVAREGLFQPIWSDRILEEWARATVKLGDAAELQARGEIAVVKAQFPNALVRPKDGDLARLYLPDPNDIHVLAAAIAGSADLLVTLNIRDFPRGDLAAEGIRREVPDAFLMELCRAEQDTVLQVVSRVHAKASQFMEKEPALRDLLKRARLPRLGKLFSAPNS